MIETLDFESADDADIAGIVERFEEFGSTYWESGKLYELHERILIPALDIRRDSRVVEIGVGYGKHLGSYVDFDYTGFDVDNEGLYVAQQMADRIGIDGSRIKNRKKARLPLFSGSVDRLFSVCTLHENHNIPRELEEMDRVVKQNGKIAIVERACAIAESPREIGNLKSEPLIVGEFLKRKGYHVNFMRFGATYWGESLTDEPKFNFYLILGER